MNRLKEQAASLTYNKLYDSVEAALAVIDANPGEAKAVLLAALGRNLVEAPGSPTEVARSGN